MQRVWNIDTRISLPQSKSEGLVSNSHPLFIVPEQTDCLADFPRSVMMMGVVIPEGCQSYGIHLALPALWSRSSHRGSLLAFVETKFRLSSLQRGNPGSLQICQKASNISLFDRVTNTGCWALRVLVCIQKVNRAGLAPAAGAVFYLAHLTLDDWFLCASVFPQGFIPQGTFSLFLCCSQTLRPDYSFYLTTLRTCCIWSALDDKRYGVYSTEI